MERQTILNFTNTIWLGPNKNMKYSLMPVSKICMNIVVVGIGNSTKNRVINKKEGEKEERNRGRMEGDLEKTIIWGNNHISKSDDSLDLIRTVTEMTSYR